MFWIVSLRRRFIIFSTFQSNFIFFVFIIIICFKYMVVEADLIIALSKKEEKSLIEFFHALLWGSEVGYVLYGEKPVCTEPYNTGSFDITGKLMHRLSTSITEGVHVWKKLNLPFETSDFMFLIKEPVEGEKINSQIMFINKKAFRKVFYNNSSLFQYRLGPGLTADQLLNELKNSEQNLFSLLRNDKVLIGILLGFGFENSLYVSRCEQIQEILDMPTPSFFDHAMIFKNKQNKKFNPPLEYLPILPSLGHASLLKELDAINDKIEIASASLEYYSPKLIFGKINPSNDSSQKLIHSYEKTQLKIISILDNSKWLEQILFQFYGEPIKIIVKEKKPNKTQLINNKIDVSELIANAIYERFNDEFADTEKDNLLNLIEGMKEAEKRTDAHYIAPFLPSKDYFLSSEDDVFIVGFKMWSYYKFYNKKINLYSVINNLKNIRENKLNLISSSRFSKFLPKIYQKIFNNIKDYEQYLAISSFREIQNTQHLNVKCLAKDRLYYQQNKLGIGKKIIKNQFIKLSYNLRTAWGTIIEDHKECITVDLSRTIKAFRVSFPFMNVGEKGILFIHPEWGIKDYLSPPYISPYLIAEFHILGCCLNSSFKHLRLKLEIKNKQRFS